ncbi:xylulokinase [Evansella tamaricis]|uniref:FGGY-family carbohydrate kinase n=1 Tax=Evansella tamaricis TaxID=2069301 RepID=A0ABS6JJK8_9BACI|nr:FGGY-family carbohydrate kinase [Evansella tamaricis]MBU9713847.1 FGGY-family carbohydrate kinase [Evansella tamaricis]
MTHVITYDIGTTGLKTCVFEITNQIQLIGSTTEGYDLKILENGGAEQDPNDWWNAMCLTTRRVLQENHLSPEDIQGISFCAQMQGLVLVDKHGEPIRKAMSYIDYRAKKEQKEGIGNGFKIGGANIVKLSKSLYITGAVSASVKDPVWKYKWVQQNEPENFHKVHKWLDVKEFLISKCTNKFVMTEDSAFATLLYDVRKGKKRFSREICQMFGVKMEHLPEIIRCTDMAGKLTEGAANELSLKEGVPVFGGGGDASLIGVGAGAVGPGSTHIYFGTSGWVSTVVKKRVLDINHMIASIIGANSGHFNYFAELETAGKCLEWVKDHLAMDESNLYLEKNQISEEKAVVYKNLYDYMMDAIAHVPAGSNGVIFTPWLHGNRCPFEDPNARGMFFNIGINSGKSDLIHAVLEGICYHFRWQLEAQEKKVNTSPVIRFVGGGALAPITCQILSNVLNRNIEVVEEPHNVGAVGAAVVTAVGLGLLSKIDDANQLIQVRDRYTPDPETKRTYDKYFPVFQSLYKNNKKAFEVLNSQ